MSIPRITLNDGTSIPQFGLGVWQVPAAEAERVVSDALEIGYRHIDTAQMYGNEEGVAQVLLRWAIDRGDIVFPKSVRKERMAQNIDVFDFALTADEVAALTALDKGEAGRQGPNPDTFDWIP